MAANGCATFASVSDNGTTKLLDKSNLFTEGQRRANVFT